jgi:hypothetical protein
MNDSIPRRPVEDAGAQTQARFRFQAEVAARRCVKILRRDGIRSIICEWHTDFVVQYSSGTLELVSVKHLEQSQPRWTMAALVDAGGLKTLCQRWCDAGANLRCTLETNAGMRTGDGEPGSLRDALAAEDSDGLRSWAEKLAPLLDVDVGTAAAFLRHLKIDDSLPGRDQIRAVNLQDHLRPAAHELRIAVADTEPVYDRIVAVVETASRDGEAGESVAALLANPDRLRSDVQLQATIARRTVDRDRLLVALRPPMPVALLALARGGTGRETILVKKLRRGDVGPTAVQSARNLRSSWHKFRATWTTGLPGDREGLEDLAARIVIAAQRAEHHARQEGSPWGDRMNRLLQDEVTIANVGKHPFAVDDHHLIGFAYELTEQCRIWFSDEFDVRADGSSD